jgi:tetratricopeptide (TPR) repeat protein
MLSRAKSLVIGSIAITLFPCAALAGQLTDQGKQLYNAGQYEKAGGYFAAEIKANPNDPTALYLLGNVFVKLNRISEAQAAYQKALLIEPNGSVGAFSRQALDSLTNKATPSQTKAHNSAATTQTNVPETQAPPNADQLRIAAECEAQINHIEESAEQKIAALRNEMRERIEANGQKRTLMLGPEVSTTRYDPEPLNESIKEEIEPQIKFIQDETKRKIEAVKAAYKARLSSYESSPGKTIKLSILFSAR